MRQPILTNEDLEKIRAIAEVDDNPLQVDDARHHLAGRSTAPPAWRRRSTRCAREAEQAVRDGINIIILSDRMAGPDRMPIPSLLATARPCTIT